MKHILGPMRKAIETFEMIKPNEKIAVGVSGGKDSMALLEALWRFQQFSPVPFDLMAITIDMGFENSDFSPIIDYCKERNIEYVIKPTDIGKIVFDIRQEKNPCALCSNLKRGALHRTAIEHGAHTIALGHHLDDVVETFLMSLIYEGRLNVFRPVTYLDRNDITLIRPFIYIKEKDIKYHDYLKTLPVIKSNCPNDGVSKRAEVKDLLTELKKQYPSIDNRILKAIQNKDQTHLWFDEEGLIKRTS